MEKVYKISRLMWKLKKMVEELLWPGIICFAGLIAIVFVAVYILLSVSSYLPF